MGRPLPYSRAFQARDLLNCNQAGAQERSTGAASWVPMNEVGIWGRPAFTVQHHGNPTHDGAVPDAESLPEPEPQPKKPRRRSAYLRSGMYARRPEVPAPDTPVGAVLAERRQALIRGLG